VPASLPRRSLLHRHPARHFHSSRRILRLSSSNSSSSLSEISQFFSFSFNSSFHHSSERPSPYHLLTGAQMVKPHPSSRSSVHRHEVAVHYLSSLRLNSRNRNLNKPLNNAPLIPGLLAVCSSRHLLCLTSRVSHRHLLLLPPHSPDMATRSLFRPPPTATFSSLVVSCVKQHAMIFTFSPPGTSPRCSIKPRVSCRPPV
jgi:hypothetical protein